MDEGEIILAALLRQGLAGDGHGWSVEIVPGGLNNRVYLVRGPHGEPVWTTRLPRQGLEWRLRYELVILTQLAGAGLACAPRRPTVVGDPELSGGDVLVHTWVPGEPLPLSDVAGRARETLGICLAGLHAHTRRSFNLWPEITGRGGTRRDVFGSRLGTLRRYNSFAGGLGGGLDARIHAAFAALHRPPPAGQGWDSREFSLIHGDLSLGNILWSGDAVRLIDWEYLRSGDPAEDLAYLTTEQPLDEARWSQIAAGYGSAGGDPRALERAVRYRPLVALDAALWWADYLLDRRLDPTSRPEVIHRVVLAESSLLAIGPLC